jgi:DNA-binding MarR family transcriptional regulator
LAGTNARRSATRETTAEVLLETVPSIMGFVSSRLRRASEVNNPVHFRLLRTLRRSSRTLHDLAELHAVRLPTMSRTVSVLERRGWISRERSTEDRRTVYAVITETGLAALAEVENMAIERATELLACLTDEENARLQEGLQALHRVVQEQFGSQFEDAHAPPPEPGCADRAEEAGEGEEGEEDEHGGKNGEDST